MVWLKMGKMQIGTAIDLSGLGLDTIEETEDEFRIGCMVTLRDLELDPGLNGYTDGAVRESVRHIVGVQFRNLATVGGSIYGRYGFSDVLTMFLAMDSYVELYKGGIIPLREYAKCRMTGTSWSGWIVKEAASFDYQSGPQHADRFFRSSPVPRQDRSRIPVRDRGKTGKSGSLCAAQ